MIRECKRTNKVLESNSDIFMTFKLVYKLMKYNVIRCDIYRQNLGWTKKKKNNIIYMYMVTVPDTPKMHRNSFVNNTIYKITLYIIQVACWKRNRAYEFIFILRWLCRWRIHVWSPNTVIILFVASSWLCIRKTLQTFMASKHLWSIMDRKVVFKKSELRWK